MELAEYLEILKRRWFIIAALITGAIASSLVASLLTKPLYQSRAKIEIKSDIRASNYVLRNPASFITEFQNPQSIIKIAQKVGLANFKGRVQLQIEAQQDYASLVGIQVTSTNAKETSLLANAIASEAGTFFNVENDPEYLRISKETSDDLSQVIANLKLAAEKARKALGKTPGTIIPGDALILSQDGWQELLELKIAQEAFWGLEKRQEDIKGMKRFPPYQASTVQFSTTPSAPIRLRVLANISFAAALGLFAGIGAAFIVEYWKQTHEVTKL